MIDNRGDSPWVRHLMFVICGLGVLLLIPWLGLRDLRYPDEPVIGEVCRAMFASGDWIAPRLFGEVWVDYPPMLYWVGCLFSYLLGGISEFTLQLPLALVAIGLALATCATGSRWILGQIGPVILRYGNLKREAFAYYTGIPVDMLETHNDLERFLRLGFEDFHL